MRFRFLCVSLIVASLSLSSLYSVNAANPKAGAVCSKVGKKQVYASKTFTCVKIGKKNVWSKVVKVVVAPKPATTPSPTPSASPSASPIPTPTPVATPTPAPTPSERISYTLAIPGIKNITYRDPSLYLTLEVEKDALGGFIRVPSLGITKEDTLTLKDANGIVRIKFDIKTVLTQRQYDVQFFAYGNGTESPCCAGTSFNSGIPPKGDEPTQPFGTSEISKYVTPPAISIAPTTSLSASTAFENLTSCKLADGDPVLTNMSSGFPLPAGRVDFTKKVVIQLLPISFSDLQTTTNPVRDYESSLTALEKFWESQSFVGTEIEIRSPTSYKQLPNPVLSYGLSSGLNGFQSQNYSSFVRTVIGLYDSEINFTEASTVVVVLPPETTSEQVGTWVVDTQNTFVTQERTIYNYMLTGSGDRKNESANWIHEYGHALGLTDMRFVDSVNPNIQRPEGLGVFDIMGSGNAAPETLLWSRFLLNVLAPKQVLCITQPSTSTHWLRPLPQRDKELKGLIIPLSSYTALVVESRRSFGFDSMLSPRDEGALVYRIDTRIPYKRSPAQIIQPSRSKDKEWYTDSALKLNEFVVSDGWKITVVETGVFGDVVRVEKA